MLSKKFIYGLFLLLAACLPAAPTPSPSPEPSPAPELPNFLCLVTDVGRVSDGTFNQYAYEGMQNLAEDYAGLTTDYIETENEEDYATNINTCVERGADIVITVGFL